MELKILYDNQTSNSNYESDWGFSCLINKTVLFDTGADFKILNHNAILSGVDFSSVSAIVVSHDHWDHTGGLLDLLDINPKLKVFGCHGFSAAFKKAMQTARVSYSELNQRSKISSHIFSTGEIIGTYNAEAISEQSLIIEKGYETGIITGCAHPGIVEIVSQVQSTLKKTSIDFLLGGFHLKDKADHEIEVIAESLKSMGVKKIGSCHCSGPAAERIFKNVYGTNFLTLCPGVTLKL